MVKANRLIAARFPARSPRGAMFPGIIRQLFFDRPLRRDSTISGQILIHVLRFTGGLSPVCTEISSYIEERGTETNERRACPDDRPSSLFEITLRSTNIHDYFSRIGGGRVNFIRYHTNTIDEDSMEITFSLSIRFIRNINVISILEKKKK